MRFDHYVEAALYDPEGGFFSRGSGAGRAGGDFLTSPEVGPLFGALFARQLDLLWRSAGRPDDFHVVEVAAGRGALAIAVRAAEPECAVALTYHLVERSAELRERQGEYLPLGRGSGQVEPAGGPTFLSHASLDQVDGPVHVVFANELLDNIAFRVLERTAEGWSEVHVDVNHTPSGGLRLVELLVPAPSLTGWADSVAPEGAHGARIPYQQGAVDWLNDALSRLANPEGRVVLVDYARTTAELAELDQNEWLRTYRDHGRGGEPLADPGRQDITTDVAWDQLVDGLATGSLEANVSQSEWLRGLGVDELVEEGRRIWNESAGAPNLAAIKARSRISEADALCDESGLGGFRVLTWRP